MWGRFHVGTTLTSSRSMNCVKASSQRWGHAVSLWRATFRLSNGPGCLSIFMEHPWPTIQWNATYPTKEASPGDKRWPFEVLCPVTRRPHQDHLHRFQGCFYCTKFPHTPKRPLNPVSSHTLSFYLPHPTPDPPSLISTYPDLPVKFWKSSASLLYVNFILPGLLDTGSSLEHLLMSPLWLSLF